MRVKIGDHWFDATVDQPIVLELTDFDKNNISKMPEENHLYAEFHDSNTWSREKKIAYMKAVELSGEELHLSENIHTAWIAPKVKSVAFGADPMFVFPLYDFLNGKMVGFAWTDTPSGVLPIEGTDIMLGSFIDSKRAHSEVAFGDESPEEILQHIESEITEVRAAPWDTKEWIDIVLLGLDGAWRSSRWAEHPTSHHTGEYVCRVMNEKFDEIVGRSTATVHTHIFKPETDGIVPTIDDEARTLDSRFETFKHRGLVQKALDGVIKDLNYRGLIHDNSKLQEPEKSAMDRFLYLNHKEGVAPFGSDEYKWRTSLLETKHHYKHNRHHPEYHTYGVNDMTLMDVVEMLCDWAAASHRDGLDNPVIHISASCDRYLISEQLRFILQNTCRAFEWSFK